MYAVRIENKSRHAAPMHVEEEIRGRFCWGNVTLSKVLAGASRNIFQAIGPTLAFPGERKRTQVLLDGPGHKPRDRKLGTLVLLCPLV